jgi:hypothetical protein
MRKIGSHGSAKLTTINAAAAAIDIGSKMHMAAVDPACADNPVRSFGAFTRDLHQLADWFQSCGVTTIAMESTGVYWIPAYEILEHRGFEVVLVNARYAKNVPGRKTDVSDASWLRQLHSYGLLRGSFRPEAKIAILRAYLGQRERLVEYAAAHIQPMQKARDGDESATPSRRGRYHWRNGNEDHPCNRCRRETPRRSRDVQRCSLSRVYGNHSGLADRQRS